MIRRTTGRRLHPCSSSPSCEILQQSCKMQSNPYQDSGRHWQAILRNFSKIYQTRKTTQRKKHTNNKQQKAQTTTANTTNQQHTTNNQTTKQPNHQTTKHPNSKHATRNTQHATRKNHPKSPFQGLEPLSQVLNKLGRNKKLNPSLANRVMGRCQTLKK